MSLAEINQAELKRKIKQAYRHDDANLHRYRTFARRLAADVKPLRHYSANAVSFVSADGGDNRITFNPAVIELVRIFDSRGGDPCVLDAVAGDAVLEVLESRIDPGSVEHIPQLLRLCAALDVDLSGLSWILAAAGQPGKSTRAIQCYRDIVEWAVLFDFATNPNIHWGTDTILVRDGLLRTISFRDTVFPKIESLMRAGLAVQEGRSVKLSVVGVAKRSAVLSRLAVALELEGTFHKNFPCYVQVPADIEAECYKTGGSWLLTSEDVESNTESGGKRYQSMGRMFLVKFGDRPMDPVWPVDVAWWQVPNVDRILGQLAVDAQQGFPIPDYPMCIQRAHEFAKVSGIEMQILEDMLLRTMCEELTEKEAERLLRFKHLHVTLASRRYMEA